MSNLIDARLAKRYVTPFDAGNPPIALQLWVSRIMTLRLYLKRGVDATDAQVAVIREDEQAAWAEIKEAADSATGLYELPLRSTDATLGVTKAGPLAYSETSPYRWTTRQREIGRQQDDEDFDNR